MFLPGLDLNFEPLICHPARNLLAGVIDVYGQAGLCAVDGTSAADNLASLCGALRWTSQDQAFYLFGSIPVDGICTTDLSREPARHRSLSARAVFQAPSLELSQHGGAQHPGQCQRNSQLADLLRFRTASDRDGAKALCQRAFWSRSERDCLRSRCHHHRSVPVGVSLGPLSLHQSGYQAAHTFGLKRQYPFFYSYQRRQVPRNQFARRVDCRTGSLLCHGSRLHRFRAPFSTKRCRQFLCHSRQVQSQSSAPLLPQSRQKHGLDLRPNRRAHRLLFAQGLRCTVAQNQVQRPPVWKNSGLSDQQLRLARAHDHSALSLALANRIVLQMDQTASAYQSFFRYHRKRGQNSNLDRYLRLRARGHRQKTSQLIGEPLRTPTNSKSDFIRKSSTNSVTCRSRLCNRCPRIAKPVEFIQLTLGHYWYGEEIRSLVPTLTGFRISNEDYIEEAIDVNKGAVEAIIHDTRKWIVEFIEEC